MWSYRCILAAFLKLFASTRALLCGQSVRLMKPSFAAAHSTLLPPAAVGKCISGSASTTGGRLTCQAPASRGLLPGAVPSRMRTGCQHTQWVFQRVFHRAPVGSSFLFMGPCFPFALIFSVQNTVSHQKMVVHKHSLSAINYQEAKEKNTNATEAKSVHSVCFLPPGNLQTDF